MGFSFYFNLTLKMREEVDIFVVYRITRKGRKMCSLIHGMLDVKDSK